MTEGKKAVQKARIMNAYRPIIRFMGLSKLAAQFFE